MAKKSKKRDAEALDKTMKRFTASWDYASSRYHNLWRDCWALRENRRVKRSHDGVIKTFVPMTFSLVETITCTLFNNRPKIAFTPNSPDQEQNTDVLTALINKNWERNKWGKKLKSVGRSTYTVGNGIVMLTWDIDHVHLQPIAIRDFIMDPCSTGPDDWEWAGRRYTTTKEKLESYEVIDIDTGEMKPRYKNLKDVSDSVSTTEGEETDKQDKESMLGTTTTSETIGQIEIIEIWDRDRVISIANRSVVIEDIENPLKEQAALMGMDDEPGIIPFAMARDYPDSSLPYAKGDVEVIMDQQELLNDLTEMNTEAALYTLQPMATLDPSLAAKYMNRMQRKPGAVFPFPAGTFQQITPPVIPANVFNERANIKSEIREATAIDQVVKGVTSATSQTATEIKAQLGQASQRIESKARDLEEDFFPQIATIWYYYFRLYAQPQFVRVITAKGPEYLQFNPEAFFGEYVPQVQLEITRELEQAKRMENARLMYQMLIQDPTNNLMEIKKRVLPDAVDLPQEDIDAIIAPQEAPNPMIGGAMPQSSQELGGAIAPEPMIEGMPQSSQELGGAIAPEPMIEGAPV